MWDWSPIAGQEHHWWPKSLSKSWADSNGNIGTIHSRGNIRRYPPGAICKLRDGHNEILEGPWAGGFEKSFDKTDNEIPFVREWLVRIVEQVIKEDRVTCAIEIPDNVYVAIMSSIASLIARNPTTRLQAGIISYSVKNISEPGVPRLIAPAINGLYEHFLAQMRGGRLGFLIAKEGEFIFGDGFFHNFPSGRHNLSNPICIVPLHPSVSVIWLKPSSSYMINPRTMSAIISEKMLMALNFVIQIYSNEYLYFREKAPELTDVFKEKGHHEFGSQSGDDQPEIIDLKKLVLKCAADNALRFF